LRGKRWIVSQSLHSFWLGSYEISKQKVMAQHLKPGDIFYDIGANVGFYTLFGAHFVKDHGHVYSFEPFPEVACLVEKHIALNNLKNVSFYPIAISDTNGTAHFQVGASDGMGKIANNGTLEVKVASLDSLIQDQTIRPATVMKIDVEGGEYGVLKGAASLLKEHKPLIFLATHGDQIHQQCVEFLNQFGYQIESFRSIDGGGEVLAR
jgi:FkbM family methyltransferase